MIPAEIKFDANATPPQWTDDGEQVIEKGTNIRIKIKGLRSEVDKMYAVGTMKEVRTIPVSLIDFRLSNASRIIFTAEPRSLFDGTVDNPSTTQPP